MARPAIVLLVGLTVCHSAERAAPTSENNEGIDELSYLADVAAARADSKDDHGVDHAAPSKVRDLRQALALLSEPLPPAHPAGPARARASQFENDSCRPGWGPVFVRVRNASRRDIESVEAYGFNFGALRAGAASAYRRMGGGCVYRNAYVVVRTRGHFADGPMPCFDGEIPLATGRYTLSVTVDDRGEMHGLTRDAD